jgi:PKHD-type hydroxylase
MLVEIPLLSPDEVPTFRDELTRATWEDGNSTAGHQSALVKRNLQVPESCPRLPGLRSTVLRALAGNGLFQSAVLPRVIFPPMFNRYEGGMGFGLHVDNALRPLPGTDQRIRTDVSVTLFLSDPESYDGGELIIEDTYGTHEVKLEAGCAVAYPSTSLHLVRPVTRGVRLASFFWVQSLVREAADRATLFELDGAIMSLNQREAGSDLAVRLTGTYHNLLRRWTDR